MNSSTKNYYSEQYENELEEVKNSTNIIENNVIPILGGNQYYYELFKAIDGGNQP